MPLSDQARIARAAAYPRIVLLWRALTRLRGLATFMNTGAHPDDETSAMLAALGLRDGLDLSYACATRGEGGQNAIGTEAGAALGVLRTAEMEAAADILGMRLYWLSEGPGDSITDFGFSKSGSDTLKIWGRTRTLSRFADIIRRDRPDIICPTFLDIPGQHGHHRAMTETAHMIMDLAADPAFEPGEAPPWQVKKLYLPAWSGAGRSYDDDLPPPPATLEIAGDGIDPVTGMSFAQIGEQSRACHRSQGMGRWIPLGAARHWPLHLADTRLSGPDRKITDGLPCRLADLSDDPALARADDACAAALAAFPDFDQVGEHALAAFGALEGMRVAPDDAHRLARRRRDLCRVIQIASGVVAHAHLDRDILQNGDNATLRIEQQEGRADQVTITPILPAGWAASDTCLRLNGAALSDPTPAFHDPGAPRAPAITVKARFGDSLTETQQALLLPPIILPDRRATASPARDIINLADPRRACVIRLDDIAPIGATPTVTVPPGWQAAPIPGGLRITAPKHAPPGRYVCPVTIAGEPARRVQKIAHDGLPPRALITKAEIEIAVIEAALPPARIGVIAGHDRVAHWLGRMGFDVSLLSDADLGSETTLAGFDSIVIGICALKSRPEISANISLLHQWVRGGGTLLSLYHRPWDNWDPAATPLAPLEIGQPSLRWRVTDAAAEVTPLAPHPILAEPNRIDATDWGGWAKERGLYFASAWDPAYTPLLSMRDPGEDPLHGALLAGDFGAGRHVHCALILHHQMDHLVSGAFRLMANLLAKRG